MMVKVNRHDNVGNENAEAINAHETQVLITERAIKAKACTLLIYEGVKELTRIHWVVGLLTEYTSALCDG